MRTVGTKQYNDPLLTLKGHMDSVTSIAFSSDKSIRDAQTCTLENTLVGHTGWMISVAYSPDGTKIISCSEDIRNWNAQSAILENTLEGHMGGVISVAFSVIWVG